jgi:hypothetical protein
MKLMRKEYDFSKGVRGKYVVPLSQIQLPIYLEPGVQSFFVSEARRKRQDTSKLVNALLKREMRQIKKAK